MANSLPYNDIWTRRASYLFFNVKKCTIDEYERYNTWRRERYDRQDAKYTRMLHMFYSLLMVLLAALFISV